MIEQTAKEGRAMSDPPLALAMDNAFWDFSCAVYAAPGVREACLALQDRFGLDVNLALLCAWVGADRAGSMRAGHLAAAAALVGGWQDEVVRPLRDVRQRIKRLALMADPAVASFRGRVAGIELEAERLQQAMLFGWADPRWPGRGTPPGGVARANLQVLLAARSDGATAEAVSAIAALARAAEEHAAFSAR
jgi:uncharacterized protein (TIGR02444 family)